MDSFAGGNHDGFGHVKLRSTSSAAANRTTQVTMPTRRDPKEEDMIPKQFPKSAIVAVFASLALTAAACGSNTDNTTADVPAGAPLELSLGEGDALASCMPFEVDVLAAMSPAFAGTATAVDGDSVTLDIDHWYTGGDAATATLSAPTGMQALIAGFDFEVGAQYLITAAGANVNYCGYSGLATPEMSAAYQQAFEN